MNMMDCQPKAFRLAIAITIAIVTFGVNAWASAPALTTLYEFSGNPDGCNSYAGVVFDKAGNIYGTTTYCGEFSDGTVFELSPPAMQGGEWTETIVYSFGSYSGDGGAPSSGLILDSKGALYGETIYGGKGNYGTVFKLTPPAMPGGNWAETILYDFCANNMCYDGANPLGGLVFDKKGNLYGTTYEGSSENGSCCGVVFELIKPPGKEMEWTESVLYSFRGNYYGGNDGNSPQSGVIFDKARNLYGTTYSGGDYTCTAEGCGTVFQLSPEGGSWTESILYTFQGTGDGKNPTAGLVLDKSGALYGTTTGGPNLEDGNVFKLAPPEAQGGTWSESVLYSFQGAPDGSTPDAGLIFDGKNLVGTTLEGGTQGWPKFCDSDAGCGGTIFELTPPKTGTGAWAEKILWDFGNESTTAGSNPAALLTLKDGAFYGTTSNNAAQCQFGCGAVFELVP